MSEINLQYDWSELFIEPDDIAGQTFSPRQPWTLNWIDARIKPRTKILDYYLPPTVYKANAGHLPYGSPVSLPLRLLTVPVDTEDYLQARWIMSPVLLEEDEYYVILWTHHTYIPFYNPRMQYQNGIGTYTRGIRIYKAHDSLIYLTYPADDMMFAAFGSPPVPQPRPEPPKPEPPHVPQPPVEKFAVINLVITETPTGVILVMTSSTPCHAYMYYTKTEPDIHTLAVTQRGLSSKAASKYCFVIFHTNEQEEPGDTIDHTFIKDPWPN